MSDLTKNQMLRAFNHPIPRMSAKDKALVEQDQALLGRCMWREYADGKVKRIPPEKWPPRSSS